MESKDVVATSQAWGYVMDGYGALHPISTTVVVAPSPSDAPFWPGWDIARGLAL